MVDGRDAVIPVRAEARDAGEFGHAPRGTAAGQHGHQVDRLGDQRAGYGDDGFLNELFHPPQSANGAAGVDRADTAGMAGAPCLQEVESFRAAHLTDGDAVGAQA